MEISIGKSYNLRVPTGEHRSNPKVHIDNIMDNPKYKGKAYNLVLFRIWSKRYKCWNWYVEPYYRLAIFNDWEYKNLD